MELALTRLFMGAARLAAWRQSAALGKARKRAESAANRNAG